MAPLSLGSRSYWVPCRMDRSIWVSLTSGQTQPESIFYTKRWMAHCFLGMLIGNITHLQLSDFRVVFVIYLVKSANTAALPGSVALAMTPPCAVCRPAITVSDYIGPSQLQTRHVPTPVRVVLHVRVGGCGVGQWVDIPTRGRVASSGTRMAHAYVHTRPYSTSRDRGYRHPQPATCFLGLKVLY